MEIKALLVASVLAGQFGLCYASSDGDLIEGIIPEPDSISVTSVVREPFHPDFEKHCAGLTAGKTPACLKITRVREADGLGNADNRQPPFHRRGLPESVNRDA